MDSEDSNSASTASNNSSSTEENSNHNTPTHDEEKKSPETAAADNLVSDCNNIHRYRKLSTSSSQKALRSLRSSSKTGSDSSSSSSGSDNDDDGKSAISDAKTKSKYSSEGSSSDEEMVERPASRTTSPIKSSPIRSSQSSRNSSESSNNSESFNTSKEFTTENGAANICAEDLSDVSDMESDKRMSPGSSKKVSTFEEDTNECPSEKPTTESNDVSERKTVLFDGNSNEPVITDLRQKLDQKKNHLKAVEISSEKPSTVNRDSAEILEDLVKTHDEDALDFEAEEGECQEIGKNEFEDEKRNDKMHSEKCDDKDNDDGELEEGEVTDEDEKRPEETEPKPVCRFYTRGQCTWGMSCRFLHPGVTDKGNYTMFDLVRSVPVQGGIPGSRPVSNYTSHSADYHDYRTERPSVHHRVNLPSHQPIYPAHSETRSAASSVLPGAPVMVESAWERGLRTAKEMMRKANKRKEQDMDFEDKKMNLTLSPDELEKDPYYLKERASPPPKAAAYGRHALYQEAPSAVYNSPDRFPRGLPISSFDEVDPYGRSSRYRELPPHRMPQYEDDRRVRPTREVIVQRVEQIGRADEWSDPWMRTKSPGERGTSRDHTEKRRRDRSYSSNSSYSTSTSSDSDSSSESSNSPSSPEHRRRFNSTSHKSPNVRRHLRTARSPSLPQKRMKHSPTMRRTPIPKRSARGHMSPSPVIEKRSTYTSAHKRAKVSPFSKKASNENIKTKRHHTSSTSESGSSDSSASDSDSNSVSSSSQSSSVSKDNFHHKRVRTLEKISNTERKMAKKEPPKKRSPISIEIKKLATVGASALTSPTNSVSSDKDTKKTRREELLKQLRAVEDAIAKKRSKLT